MSSGQNPTNRDRSDEHKENDVGNGTGIPAAVSTDAHDDLDFPDLESAKQEIAKLKAMLSSSKTALDERDQKIINFAALREESSSPISIVL